MQQFGGEGLLPTWASEVQRKSEKDWASDERWHHEHSTPQPAQVSMPDLTLFAPAAPAAPAAKAKAAPKPAAEPWTAVR